MTTTAISLLESSMIPNVDLLTKNTMVFNRLNVLSENSVQRLGYIPQKVIVCESPDLESTYLIEFSDNLERLMNDQIMDISEAVNSVAEANNINAVDCIVVFRESDLSKINLYEIIQNESLDFSVARLAN